MGKRYGDPNNFWRKAMLLSFVAGMKLSLAAINIANDAQGYSNSVLFETHRAPSTFTKLEILPPADHKLNLRIGLKSQRFEESIEEILEQITNVTHPSFRLQLTDQEMDELVKPEQKAIDEVFDWLKSHDLQSVEIELSPQKDWISLDHVPLHKVEKMLDTKYAIFRHEDGEHLVRTESYSLPKHLHQHIDLIQPTTMFGRLHAQKSSVRVVGTLPASKLNALLDYSINNTCNDPSSVTNDCLRQLYKTEGYQVTSSNNNAIGITGYLNEAANFADAQKFLSTQRKDQTNGSFGVVLVNGGQNPQTLTQNDVAQQLGVEANLDTQTALGITLPTQNIFYSTGGSPPFQPDMTTPSNTNEPYLDWLTYILQQPISQVPRVITTSYGDNEQTVPQSYAYRVCNAFAQLSAKGVSVIFSSGDYGVGQNGACYANNGQQTPTFLPTFPATCPYVTSVGATQNFSPEVAVSTSGPGGFTSGGGFSNYFQIPSWQQRAVQDYLRHFGDRKHAGLYNRQGRGFPDVSAQGAKYVIVWQGTFMTVSGTSASAPTFASVIALLNDYSISQGGTPLGYLNPWLYAVGRNALNDIRSGSSAGCDTSGFPAAKGWDPVTGLGTPDFLRLKAMVASWVASTKNARRA